VVVVGVGGVVKQAVPPGGGGSPPVVPAAFPYEANRRAVVAVDHLVDTVLAVCQAHLDAQDAVVVDLYGPAADRFTGGLEDRCAALCQLSGRLHQQLDDLTRGAALARAQEPPS
jgi:hypothetical protein